MQMRQTKGLRWLSPAASNSFIGLPDHLIIFILGKVAASADSPSDLISMTITCTRFSVLGLDTLVLSKASLGSLAVRAKTWCESAERFLSRCADAGNVEACYILGMIRFYCLQSSCRISGAMLIKKAVMGLNFEAIYSQAVIQFNSSGRAAKSHQDFLLGVKLAGLAARKAHPYAFIETRYRLLEGYEVQRDIEEGRRYLFNRAKARAKARDDYIVKGSASLIRCTLWWSIMVAKQHPANRFMVEWFEEGGRAKVGEGLGVCSNMICGRPETRSNEFRRCSLCWKARYCTRTCSLFDLRVRHMVECIRMHPPAAAAAPQPPAEGGA